MNPEIKTLWIEALESGEYKQGRGFLRKGDEFCCLGVLCDIAVKEGAITVESRNDDDVVFYDGSPTMLPESVADWSEVPYDGALSEFGESLWELNDISGQSFAEIAEVIRNRY